MRTLEEVERAFAVGWSAVPRQYSNDKLKDAFADMAYQLWVRLPNGPDKTLALRSLWRTQSEAQLALSLAEAVSDVS